jgi:hypothetical protein
MPLTNILTGYLRCNHEIREEKKNMKTLVQYAYKTQGWRISISEVCWTKTAKISSMYALYTQEECK